MAWLATTPEGKHQSRMDRMRADGEPTPPLPPNPAPYLTQWLFEIGPLAGENTLGWRDFVAWQEISGVELLPWEARLLRRLSAEYASERYAAVKPDRIMPYRGDRDEIELRREAISAKVAAIFA